MHIHSLIGELRPGRVLVDVDHTLTVTSEILADAHALKVLYTYDQIQQIAATAGRRAVERRLKTLTKEDTICPAAKEYVQAKRKKARQKRNHAATESEPQMVSVGTTWS